MRTFLVLIVGCTACGLGGLLASQIGTPNGTYILGLFIGAGVEMFYKANEK